MDITKPNDIFVASFNNPDATTYDLMSNDVTPDNTSLYTKDQYKDSKFVQDKFKTSTGDFDNVAFENAYNIAAAHYQQMTDTSYINSLNDIKYSPFDTTRPDGAKTFKVDVDYTKDVNPYKQIYGRTALNSVDDGNFSIRELAQQNKVYDWDKKQWLDKSANDLGLLDKLFGQTMVYAQWDEDGTHKDPNNGVLVNHKKGDWKTTDDGNFYIETLGAREVYGKKVVNPMDILTTDGSFANRLDFFDSDDKESSILKTTVKLAANIAPLLIPGVSEVYAGVRTAVSMAAVLPTFYKAVEGLLIGDVPVDPKGPVTAAENYMAKFTAKSGSDESQSSMFNYEQMAQMVGDTFALIYEQRAAASLSKLMKSSTEAKVARMLQDPELKEVIDHANDVTQLGMYTGKFSVDEAMGLREMMLQKVPKYQEFLEAQSGMAKSLSLAYMSMSASGELYGSAIEAGYDRRTAGFAALAATAGQYSMMVNNRMGDWFLDKTTGYSRETNNALMRKSVEQYLEPIKGAFDQYAKSPDTGKQALGGLFKQMRSSIYDTFTNPTVVGEALFKNALIQGVEGVSLQAATDATKGMVDTMSYLGLTKKKGSFNTFDNTFSQTGLERYLSGFVGGLLGGALFEFHRTSIEPWLKDGTGLSPDTQKSVYELVANGHTDDLIDEINKQRSKLGNKYLAFTGPDGTITSAEAGKSQADVVADTAIKMVKNLDGIFNSTGTAVSDVDIINKAFMDASVIADLKKSSGNGKIGIEGVVLDDFKRISDKLVDLKSKIDKLSTTDEDKATNKLPIDTLTAEYRDNEKKRDAILNGEDAEKYFTQANFYLSKNISKDWLVIDKDTFTKAKYDGKSFISLPKGENNEEGLTQTRVEKEWKDYLDSKDLRKYLDITTNAYLELEKNLNKPIADYVDTGYSEEITKTYKGLIDLNNSINLFNTATTYDKKVVALDHFIKVNNDLSALKLNKIVPWDVYHSDMYNQLDKLGLIQKITYSDPDIKGSRKPNVGSYTEDELNSKVENTVTKKDQNKVIVENFFKKFPINPLNAEPIIDKFNEEIERRNRETYAKIDALESLPNKTEDNINELNNAKSQLYDIYISPLRNTPDIQRIIQESNDQLNVDISTLGITKDGIESYKEKVVGKDYNDLNSTLGSFDNPTSDWKDLTREDKIDLVKQLEASFLVDKYSNSLKEGSPEVETNVTNAIGNLRDLDKELTPDNEETINKLFDYSKEELNTYNALKNDPNYEEALDKETQANEQVEKKIQAAKPNILKINNYALDLVTKEINKGNRNKELFDQGKKLVDGELNNLKNSLFIKLKNLTNDQVLDLRDNIGNYGEQINVSGDPDLTIGEVADNLTPEFKTLKEILINSYDRNKKADDVQSDFWKMEADIPTYKNSLDQIDSFLKINESESKFISNPLYDFIRKFSLTLNSDPTGKINKIFVGVIHHSRFYLLIILPP